MRKALLGRWRYLREVGKECKRAWPILGGVGFVLGLLKDYILPLSPTLEERLMSLLRYIPSFPWGVAIFFFFLWLGTVEGSYRLFWKSKGAHPEEEMDLHDFLEHVGVKIAKFQKIPKLELPTVEQDLILAKIERAYEKLLDRATNSYIRIWGRETDASYTGRQLPPCLSIDKSYWATAAISVRSTADSLADDIFTEPNASYKGNKFQKLNNLRISEIDVRKFFKRGEFLHFEGHASLRNMMMTPERLFSDEHR